MATNRYRPFCRQDFEVLMTQIGFTEVCLDGVFEHVYQRIIYNGPFPSDRFAIRIYSSVDIATTVTRDNGSDAIQIFLYDLKINKIVCKWKVHRTKNALLNTKERARDAWNYVMKAEHHCHCNSLMVERSGKRGIFLGCNAFPTCNYTRTPKGTKNESR